MQIIIIVGFTDALPPTCNLHLHAGPASGAIGITFVFMADVQQQMFEALVVILTSNRNALTALKEQLMCGEEPCYIEVTSTAHQLDCGRNPEGSQKENIHTPC